MCHPDLNTLINAAKFILIEIARHPDYQALNYHPDLTIGDAQTALSYLQCELEENQQPSDKFDNRDYAESEYQKQVIDAVASGADELAAIKGWMQQLSTVKAEVA
jgi:hypothetical protein